MQGGTTLRKAGSRFAPESVEELSELVRETQGPIVFGAGAYPDAGAPTAFKQHLARTVARDIVCELENGRIQTAIELLDTVWKDTLSLADYLELDKLAAITEYDPADQVVTIGAGRHITGSFRYLPELLVSYECFFQRELARQGQCLPIVPNCLEELGWMDDVGGTVSLALSLNFPHSLQSQCGSWRDWVLGMTVVLADGTIVKTGSKAVKSVAGYDVHKLMIGAYDTLGIVVDVTLRTFPLKALPEPDLTWGDAKEKFKGERAPGKYVWRQRVLRSHYQDALIGAGDNLLYADNAGCTLWCWLDSPDQELPRYPGDWVVRTGCGVKNIQITDPTQIRFMKRAKAIFDPEGKLNPGEFGFL